MAFFYCKPQAIFVCDRVECMSQNTQKENKRREAKKFDRKFKSEIHC